MFLSPHTRTTIKWILTLSLSLTHTHTHTRLCAQVCFGWLPCLVVPVLCFGIPSLIWQKPPFITKLHDGENEQQRQRSIEEELVDMKGDDTSDDPGVLSMQTMPQEEV